MILSSNLMHHCLAASKRKALAGAGYIKCKKYPLYCEGLVRSIRRLRRLWRLPRFRYLCSPPPPPPPRDYWTKDVRHKTRDANTPQLGTALVGGGGGWIH